MKGALLHASSGPQSEKQSLPCDSVQSNSVIGSSGQLSWVKVPHCRINKFYFALRILHTCCEIPYSASKSGIFNSFLQWPPYSLLLTRDFAPIKAYLKGKLVWLETFSCPSFELAIKIMHGHQILQN